VVVLLEYISGTFVGGYDPSANFSVCYYFADTGTSLYNNTVHIARMRVMTQVKHNIYLLFML